MVKKPTKLSEGASSSERLKKNASTGRVTWGEQKEPLAAVKANYRIKEEKDKR